jgi:hypothetical protein
VETDQHQERDLLHLQPIEVAVVAALGVVVVLMAEQVVEAL